MTAKKKALEVISRMPDDSTLDDIGYELYVIESIERGMAELDKGDFLTQQEAKAELGRWLK